jgi:polynucleotide 5'-hydroxyl-kinase GRC3/NOL9
LDSRDLCLKHNAPALEYPTAWQRAIAKLFDNPQDKGSRIVLICGALRSGKSTFSRFLINKMLTSNNESNSKPVAFVDIDPVRPERSLPGHIGLFSLKHPVLGASFAGRMAPFLSPNISHFVGCGQQVINTPEYLSAVNDLINLIKSNGFKALHRDLIIVHCPGWYLGSGNEVVAKLISIFQPKDIAFLSDPPSTVINRMEQMAARPACHSAVTPSLPSFQSSRTRPQLSDMAMISYFHWQSLHTQKLNLTPISSWRPYSVSFGEKSRDFKAIVVLGEFPLMYSNMLSKLINGSLVSIVLVDADYQGPEVMLGEGDGLPYLPPSSKGYVELPPPPKSKTVGLGLIRSLDVDRKNMLVLGTWGISQLPSEQLLLVSGGMESPGWAYMEDYEYQTYAKQSGDTDAHVFLAKGSSEYPWMNVRDEIDHSVEVKRDVLSSIP